MYERKTKDIFDVQDDIASSIAKALRLQLAGQAATLSSAEHGTDNLKAYDLYLRGRYFWNARGAENLRRRCHTLTRRLPRIQISAERMRRWQSLTGCFRSIRI